MNAWAFDRICIKVEGRTKSNQAKIWCHENIGTDWLTDKEDGCWSWIGLKDDVTEFQFKYEQDAVFFALRWS